MKDGIVEAESTKVEVREREERGERERERRGGSGGRESALEDVNNRTGKKG